MKTHLKRTEMRHKSTIREVHNNKGESNEHKIDEHQYYAYSFDAMNILIKWQKTVSSITGLNIAQVDFHKNNNEFPKK